MVNAMNNCGNLAGVKYLSIVLAFPIVLDDRIYHKLRQRINLNYIFYETEDDIYTVNQNIY